MFADDRSNPGSSADGGRWVAVGAGVALLATATGMALGRHAPDTRTVVLTLAATLLGFLVVRWVRDHRRAGTSLHDDVDHELGVGNGRAALAMVDRELVRARIHGSAFSLAVAEFDHELFAALSHRRARRLRGRLFRGVADDVRQGDRVCRVRAAGRDLMVVVLPDTGQRGARTVSEQLRSLAQQRLAAVGIGLEGRVRVRAMAHPRDTEQVVDFHRRLQVLEDAEALIRDIEVEPVRMPRRPAGVRSIHLPEAASTGR